MADPNDTLRVREENVNEAQRQMSDAAYHEGKAANIPFKTAFYIAFCMINNLGGESDEMKKTVYPFFAM